MFILVAVLEPTQVFPAGQHEFFMLRPTGEGTTQLKSILSL